MREEKPSWPAQCRSCATNLHGPYCSACGESHVYGRLELRALVEDALRGLANLDTRVLRTIGDLTVAPAKVCRYYLDGRRVQTINPFKYALAGFTFAILVAESLTEQLPIAGTKLLLLDFAVMPLLAALLWPMFATAPRRLRWVEHYVVVLFSLGHVALLFAVLMPLLDLAGPVGSAVFALMPPAMLSWAAVGVYETRWWTTIPRVLLGLAVMQAVVFGVLRLSGI